MTNLITKRLATDLAVTFEGYRNLEAQLEEYPGYAAMMELLDLGYKLADLQRKTGIVLINAKFLSAADSMERWPDIS
tara:strand:+ start:369 stop:599 length:231 start_codon:yes stop_codon:yes gene_type:complete